MPRYVSIDAKRIEQLHDALELLEMLDRDQISGLDLHVYGISNNPQILDAAREAIAESKDLAEEDVQITEVAVAIPLSADTIYYLVGSGLKLNREDFVYRGTGGEGIRTLSFTFGHYHPSANLRAFTTLALASSDAWLDDFFAKEGNHQLAQITPNVRRDAEATQPAAPVAPTASLKISSFLDEFLD